MPEIAFPAGRIVFAAAAGYLLGGVYFLGLWWTSRRIGMTRAPSLLFMTSFAVRMAMLLTGLWLATRGRLLETAAAVLGLLVARGLVVNYVRRGLPDSEEGTGEQA